METIPHHRLLGIGFGPSHLAMAALHASGRPRQPDLHFLESRPAFSWHPDMLLPGTRMQVAFLKDLVTPYDPTSPFSFTSYLVAHDRLESFLDLGTLNPTRHEFADYLGWAAARLDNYVSYSSPVEQILPVLGPDGSVTHLQVDHRTADGYRRSVLTDHVSLAPGGDPVIPAGVEPAALEQGAVVHSSNFLSGLRRLRDIAPSGRTRRFLVVGGGQSAAEIFRYLSTEFPHDQVTLVHRGFALFPADSSPLVNEIFAPAAVDLFHGADALRRRRILSDLRATNYAAVDEEDIRAIHEAVYAQRVAGTEPRLTLSRFTELREGRLDGAQVAVTLRDLLGDQDRTERFDAVFLATGFDFREARGLLADLEPYLLRAPDGTLSVTRDYAVGTQDGFAPRIYLHGAAEHTHGLTATLLSMVARRAGDVLDSLLGPPPGRVSTEPTEPITEGAFS